MYIVCFFLSCSVVSQEENKKSLTSSAKRLNINLVSANEIELLVNDSKEELAVIYSNTDAANEPQLFEKNGSIHIETSREASVLKGTEKNKYRAGQPLYPNYKIVIPEGLNVQLFYDNGNFSTKDFNGNLDIHLSSGDVLIDNFSGKINITSYAGKIICVLTRGEFFIENSKGVLESFLKDVELTRSGNLLKGKYKDASNLLKVKTVRSKVILKPAKQ